MTNFIKVYRDRLDEIREEYPILNAFGDLWAMELYDSFKKNQITEFIQTVPHNVTVRTLKQKYDIPDSRIKTVEERPEDYSIKVLLEPEDFDRAKDILGLMGKFGWYPSGWVDRNRDGQEPGKSSEDIPKILEKGNQVVVLFEPHYNSSQEIEPVYYHITPELYVDKIDKIGLTPKTHNKIAFHPGRIYLLRTVDVGDVVSIAQLLYNKAKTDVRIRSRTMQVYRVQTKGLNNFKVYEDPNFNIGNGAVYTYSNIPPTHLKKYIKVDV